MMRLEVIRAKKWSFQPCWNGKHKPAMIESMKINKWVQNIMIYDLYLIPTFITFIAFHSGHPPYHRPTKTWPEAAVGAGLLGSAKFWVPVSGCVVFSSFLSEVFRGVSSFGGCLMFG
jgi:hypothetical protein